MAPDSGNSEIGDFWYYLEYLDYFVDRYSSVIRYRWPVISSFHLAA